MEQGEMMDRQETIDALRALAEFLEERSDVPMPYLGQLNAFTDLTELPVVARAMGGFTKAHYGDWLVLVKKFGPVGLHVNIPSEQVCERVVVGTKEIPEQTIPAHIEEIIEWKCPESILKEAEDATLDD